MHAHSLLLCQNIKSCILYTVLSPSSLTPPIPFPLTFLLSWFPTFSLVFFLVFLLVFLLIFLLAFLLVFLLVSCSFSHVFLLVFSLFSFVFPLCFPHRFLVSYCHPTTLFDFPRYYNLEPSHKVLFDVNKNHNPFNNTTKMLSAVHEIIHTLQACIYHSNSNSPFPFPNPPPSLFFKQIWFL